MKKAIHPSGDRATSAPAASGQTSGETNGGDLGKLVELIDGIRVAIMMTGRCNDSPPHARPMYTQKLDAAHFDGTLWFMTDAGSKKLDEIARDPSVILVYAAPDKNRYVVVQGVASAERDPDVAQELWNIHAKGWWPGGPDDPRLMLIRVETESAEYWDGPSNTSYMLSLLKAVMSGERVHTESDHGTLHS
ncbi:MAG: pyridoxamine 5'-phosphate oxidase family protein [Phycisphaerae bacterium]|nr:pyridoxamine 5'-phosphate oxidase family protein [Phycisphaerae bacterium]